MGGLFGARAVSGPATPQFFQQYDPGGFLSPISYPPGGARQYVFPAQQPGGALSSQVIIGALLLIGGLLVLEHFRPK